MGEKFHEDAWTLDLRGDLYEKGSIRAVDLPFKVKLPYKIGTHFIYNPIRKKEGEMKRIGSIAMSLTPSVEGFEVWLVNEKGREFLGYLPIEHPTLTTSPLTERRLRKIKKHLKKPADGYLPNW